MANTQVLEEWGVEVLIAAATAGTLVAGFLSARLHQRYDRALSRETELSAVAIAGSADGIRLTRAVLDARARPLVESLRGEVVAWTTTVSLLVLLGLIVTVGFVLIPDDDRVAAMLIIAVFSLVAAISLADSFAIWRRSKRLLAHPIVGFLEMTDPNWSPKKRLSWRKSARGSVSSPPFSRRNEKATVLRAIAISKRAFDEFPAYIDPALMSVFRIWPGDDEDLELIPDPALDERVRPVAPDEDRWSEGDEGYSQYLDSIRPMAEAFQRSAGKRPQSIAELSQDFYIGCNLASVLPVRTNMPDGTDRWGESADPDFGLCAEDVTFRMSRIHRWVNHVPLMRNALPAAMVCLPVASNAIFAATQYLSGLEHGTAEARREAAAHIDQLGVFLNGISWQSDTSFSGPDSSAAFRCDVFRLLRLTYLVLSGETSGALVDAHEFIPDESVPWDWAHESRIVAQAKLELALERNDKFGEAWEQLIYLPGKDRGLERLHVFGRATDDYKLLSSVESLLGSLLGLQNGHDGYPAGAKTPGSDAGEYSEYISSDLPWSGWPGQIAELPYQVDLSARVIDWAVWRAKEFGGVLLSTRD